MSDNDTLSGCPDATAALTAAMMAPSGLLSAAVAMNACLQF
jgi:hypothetical protein